MSKLVSMLTELKNSNDLDRAAEAKFKGQQIQAKLRDGSVVRGEVFSIMNAGFRGIEVHIYVGQAHRVASINDCKVWVKR